MMRSLSPISIPPTPRLAIIVAFFSRGFLQGNWFPRIPGIVQDLSISQSTMGATWFCVALAAIVSFSLSSKTVSRFGSRTSHALWATPLPFVFVAAALATTPPLFAVCMALFGLTNGGYDISCTAQGGIVERSTGRPLVSACYGYFSLGALLGSLVGAWCAQAGVAVWLQFSVLTAMTLPLTWYLRRYMMNDESRIAQAVVNPKKRRRGFRLPPKALIPYGMCIICIALGEETVNNWVALYLRRDLNAEPALAGLAYTLFSIATFAGRVSGDRVIAKLGVDRVLAGGSILASFGVLFAVVVNQAWAFLFGYLLVGVGLSVVVPVSYRRASEVPGIDPARAIASVASLGYVGFLIGPLFVGAMADLLSLRTAIAIVGFVLLGIVVMVWRFPGEPVHDEPMMSPESA